MIQVGAGYYFRSCILNQICYWVYLRERFKQYMQVNWKYLVPLFLLIQWADPAIFAQTRQIKDFDSLVNALSAGENVKVVIRYAKCRLTEKGNVKEKSPDAITGMEIGTFEYFAAGVIPGSPAIVVFSESKLIRNPKGKGFVLNYGKVKVFSDNSVTITAQYLEPKRLRILMDQTFEGIINGGLNEGGIYFFRSVKEP